MELIDKSALVKKLGEWMYEIRFITATIPLHGRERADAAFEYELLGKVKDFVNTFDTLETKEVDLDFQTFAKEMKTVFALPSSKTKNTEEEPLNWEYVIAKHFFELGLKAKGK